VNHNRLLLGIFIGAAGGIACGWIFGETMTAVAWVGQLFVDSLKMTVIPLVVAAVISSITSIGDTHRLGRLSALTLIYYLATTAFAVLIGLVVVNVLQPGAGVQSLAESSAQQITLPETAGITDLILTLVTPNLVKAAANGQLLPLIVFCLLFATAVVMVGQSARPVAAFFEALNDVMMRIVMWLVYLSPVGIFALIASTLGKAGGGAAFANELAAVGLYVTAVVAGLGIHFLVLCALLVVMGRRGSEYIVASLRALLTAFGTASSSATIPVSLDCAVEGGVDRRAARFIIPLGATVNMNGTALYQGVATMFIAQAYGLDMSISQQAIILITATLAAVGTAGVPQAGLVMLLIVFAAVNLPTEGLGLILAVDWFVDRCRTTINVWGDLVGAAVIERRVFSPRSQSAVDVEDEFR
jgi:Na+/H+-dicarboxylate symporter